jgi:hypothetical protein
MFASLISFVLLNFLSALLIIAFVARAKDCLTPSMEGLNFYEQFNDSLQLSWTTFTTVGYGLISPSTGGSPAFLEDPEFFKEEVSCLPVSIFLSFESLLGVLFVG